MVSVVNSKADVLKATAALSVNCNAAKSLQEIMKSNLGPRGTLKMLVGGAGQIKITKDGKALLDEMQIQHPTACREDFFLGIYFEDTKIHLTGELHCWFLCIV